MKLTTGNPKNAAAAADELYKLKEEKSKLNVQVKEIEEREKELNRWCIDNIPKQGATGVRGKLAEVEVVTEVVPSVKDWPKFYAYMVKTKAFEMLQKKLSPAAVKERWGDKGTKVPGVEPFNVTKVKLKANK